MIVCPKGFDGLLRMASFKRDIPVSTPICPEFFLRVYCLDALSVRRRDGLINDLILSVKRATVVERAS